MSTPPSKRRKKKTKKKQYWLPIAAGLLVVCVLVGGIVFLESAMKPGPEPTETATEPMPTLPPNPYSAQDFAYDGRGYLSLTSGEYQLGIDVSDHQHQIDWHQVAGAGIEFAFIRIGYRGYSEGGIYADECAGDNLRQAKAAGLQVGAYFYSQALNAEEAAEEAAFCVEFLQNYEIDLPVVFDWEYVSEEARTGAMDPVTLTQCAQTFCSAIENAGYEAMLYFNPHLAEDYYLLPELQAYPFWLAMYTDQMTYPSKIDCWQYTDAGTVPGIEGGVDINLRFTGS